MISPYELPPENRVYIIIISVLMTLNRLWTSNLPCVEEFLGRLWWEA